MMSRMSKKHRVVIVGGGFGGVYTAKALSTSVHKHAIEVTLIDRDNYFLFTPLLHEVATGGLSPLSVTLPLREIFVGKCNVTVRHGEVANVDTENKKVQIGEKNIFYDTLVIATGAETAWHGVSGAREHALSLKTLPDARAIRTRIIDCFEEAMTTESEEKKRELLTFVIVGSGATGVEFAAELSDFTCGTLSKLYPLSSEEKKMISVKLLSHGPELLTQFPSDLRDIAEDVLKKKRIDVLFNAEATEVREHEIITSTGTIPTRTVVWTAGVEPRSPGQGGSLLHVRQTLQMVGQDNVFVVGDVSNIKGAEYPMLAQVAVEQGEHVAENIERQITGRELLPFEYKIRGMIASLGQWMAVGEIHGRHFHGRFMWWLWRTIYLFKFPSLRKRLRVATEWTINLFFSRDITKI